MKKMVVLPILLLLLLSGFVHAAAQHYVNGLEGIRVATLPPPGFYYRMYNAFYHAGSYRDNDRKEIPNNFNMNTYINASRFIYSSNFQILGGRFVADLLIPVVSMNMGMDTGAGRFHDSSVGIGDIYSDPFMISWNKDRFDVSLGVGVFLPVGKFDKDNPASIGKGYWTVKGGLGATFYLDEAKSWSVSAAAHYEIHSTQRQTDIKPGDHFHIEWGVGKRFAQIFEAGVVGYNSWQVKADSGTATPAYKTAANAIGAEFNVVIPQWKAQIAARSVWEYKNRNTPQGVMTTLNLTFMF